MASEKKNFITQFPRNFWTVITMEFFERGSYYGLASVLSIYLVSVLNFSKQSVGIINSVVRPMLYLTPILAGALAERFGYRKTLFFSFSVMSLGYFLTGLTTSYELIFLSLLLMTLGAGSFKPIISGTIARTTTEQNSTLGFGIYYWSINLGAFIFPLLLVPFLKEISWSYIFFMSAIGTGWLLLLNFFVYKEPVRTEPVVKKNLIYVLATAFEILYSPIVLFYFLLEKWIKEKPVLTILLTIVANLIFIYISPIILLIELFVLLLLLIITFRLHHFIKDHFQNYLLSLIISILIIMSLLQFNISRILFEILLFLLVNIFIWFIDIKERDKYVLHSKFLLMIVIYSGFWILYFQMFDTVLWYLKDYMDMTPVNNVVNGFLGLFTANPNWKFDAEHVTVINAGTIIVLQIFISNIVKNKKALPTMITGIGLGTIGMGILAISTYAWVFMAGIIIFSIGEMTAHPKFISYVGLIAPEDKKALYLGYSFLYGVLGSGIGGILGANLYVHFIDKLHNPSALWITFSLIGVATMVGLLLFNKFLAKK